MTDPLHDQLQVQLHIALELLDKAVAQVNKSRLELDFYEHVLQQSTEVTPQVVTGSTAVQLPELG